MERTIKFVISVCYFITIISLLISNAKLNEKLDASLHVINRVFYDNPGNYALDSLQYTPEYCEYCIVFDLAGDIYDD